MYEIQSGLTAGEVAFDTEAPFDSMAIGVALENIYLKKDQEREHMLSMYKPVANLGSKERGASMVEYALLLVLIAIVAFVAVRLAGQSVSSAFSTVANGFTNPN